MSHSHPGTKRGAKNGMPWICSIKSRRKTVSVCNTSREMPEGHPFRGIMRTIRRREYNRGWQRKRKRNIGADGVQMQRKRARAHTDRWERVTNRVDGSSPCSPSLTVRGAYHGRTDTLGIPLPTAQKLPLSHSSRRNSTPAKSKQVDTRAPTQHDVDGRLGRAHGLKWPEAASTYMIPMGVGD